MTPDTVTRRHGQDPHAKYCIIGAGPAGLTAAKNLVQRGVPFDCFERQDDVGGNWYYGRPSSSVYASTHLISSKRMTQYPDFPMPRHYPPFPSHRQVLAYLRGYAETFGLYRRITFNRSVKKAEPVGQGWQVTLDDGQPARHYRGVIIANGHHWDPHFPNYEGAFQGQVIHSCQYKTPDLLQGRRVLVVGAGNSGCDIAVEAAQNAEAVFHSLRRGYHFLPKFLFGRPIDSCGEQMHRWRLPRWLQRWLTGWAVRIALGLPQRYGLPAPDHKLLETHPIINSQLLYYVGHGDIRIKPEVQRLCGDQVRFVDGSQEAVDLIILATGYKTSFPFLDPQLVLDNQGRPRLYLNVFHPQYDSLFAVGLIQPNSGLWGLADYQAQLVGSFLVALERDPAKADWLRRLKAQPAPDLSGGIQFVNSPRHLLEVDYFSYRRLLQQRLAQFGPCAHMRLDG